MRTTKVQHITLAALLGVGGLLGATACGEDETDDTLATTTSVAEGSTTTTTTADTAESTTTTAPPATDDSSTTTAPPADETTAAGKAVLTMSTGVTPMDVTSCSSSGESSLTLTAVDADGNQLEIRARNDVGAALYHLPAGNREGAVVRVTVGSEEGFNVVGGLDGVEFTLTGRCP